VDLRAAQERIGLDLGELSALTLAKEIQADLILLDDLAARRIAQRDGLRVQGTVGILEACFARGHLRDLRHAYQELLHRGVYLDRVFLNARLAIHNLKPL
jgi:predicted nucleic acid-binding protein